MTLNSWDMAFRSEWGRDRALSDAIDDAASAAAAANRRLSSNLSELQGSMEKRLTALTTAFDAYVELGDVRERLRQLPDARPTLAAVRVALDQLISGQPADRIDTEKHDHWLAHATNAVAELTEGRPSAASEADAVERSSEAPLFIATALLALGRADVLKGRLAALFAGADSLSEVRGLLFDAATAGRVDAAELKALGEALQPAIAASDEWWVWLGTSPDNAAGRSVVVALLDGMRPAKGEPDGSHESLDDQLRSTAVALAGAGSDEERTLLARAQLLRERIESPDGFPDVPEVFVPVVTLIREAIDDAATPSAVREAMVGWLRPMLADMVTHWRQLPPSEGVTRVERIGLRAGDNLLGRADIPVTRGGGEPEALRRARTDFQRLAEPLNATSFWAGAAVALVLAVMLMVTGHPGFITLGVAVLAVGGWLGFKGFQQQRDNQQKAEGLAVALKQLSGGLNDVRDQVRAEEQTLADGRAVDREELDALIRRLGRAVPVEADAGPMFLAATPTSSRDGRDSPFVPFEVRATQADAPRPALPAEGPDFLAPEPAPGSAT